MKKPRISENVQPLYEMVLERALRDNPEFITTFLKTHREYIPHVLQTLENYYMLPHKSEYKRLRVQLIAQLNIRCKQYEKDGIPRFVMLLSTADDTPNDIFIMRLRKYRMANVFEELYKICASFYLVSDAGGGLRKRHGNATIWKNGEMIWESRKYWNNDYVVESKEHNSMHLVEYGCVLDMVNDVVPQLMTYIQTHYETYICKDGIVITQ